MWKQNKMLPEHYCEFLLSLYSEGNNQPKKKESFILRNWWYLLTLYSLMIPISVFVIYFTELSNVLQTVILLAFVVLLFFSAIYFSDKEKSFPLLFIQASVIFFMASLHFNLSYEEKSEWSLYLILFINCIFWGWIGLKWRLTYFYIASALGSIVILIFIFK